VSNQVEIILSPLLLPLYHLQNKVVVVIDILRATSTICAALDNGASSVIPVVSVEDALSYPSDEYLIAGEREGKKVPGFNFGNSPLEYGTDVVQNKDVVLTTTNGTKCIKASSDAEEILVGSFFNISVLANYLNAQSKDVILFCSGWKNSVNLEDTIFAGALAQRLLGSDTSDNDSCELAVDLYRQAENKLGSYLEKASHAKRFSRLGNHKDLELCLTFDLHPVLVQYQIDRLVSI
jgi:2-phosphosulfolactate phosphatase